MTQQEYVLTVVAIRELAIMGYTRTQISIQLALSYGTVARVISQESIFIIRAKRRTYDRDPRGSKCKAE